MWYRMVQFPNQITQSVIIRDANGNIIVNIGPTQVGAAVIVQAAPPSQSLVELSTDLNNARILITDTGGKQYTIEADPTAPASLNIEQVSANGVFLDIVHSGVGAVNGAIMLGTTNVLGNPSVALDGTDGYIKKAAFSGGAVVVESFQNLTLQNGWTNWGSGFAPFSVRRLGTVCAHLEGTIRPGTTANGTVIAVLGAGFIPVTGIQRIPVTPNGYFDIDASGNIILNNAVGTPSVSVCADFTIVGAPN